MLLRSSMAPSSLDPFTHYSKTQRVVLLLDLNPFLDLQDPNPYLKSLLSAAKTLLTFSPLSKSLFSFRPFFSSLSPVLSSAKLPDSSLSLSFNSPSSTLQSLTQFFNSLSDSIGKSALHSCPSRASNLAASMCQILHDYPWHLLVQDPVLGKSSNCDSCVSITSNLVVLFSPVIRDFNGLTEFLGVAMGDECLRNETAFTEKLFGVFRTVIDAFLDRDIHCCWVDVKSELGKFEKRQCEQSLGFLDSGIKNLGWGFCSGDSIVLGSALVPFGLIYPKIGFLNSSYFDCDFNSPAKTVKAQLSLEILDVNGQPLECNICELEFVDLRVFPTERPIDVFLMPGMINTKTTSDHDKEISTVGKFCKEMTKIRIKAVRKYDQCAKVEGHLSNVILVRELLGEHGADKKENPSDFYAYKVLQMLAMEMGESWTRRPVPIWPILLSFLYRNCYCALVSVSNGDCDLHMGILKPFTVSSAVLSIVEDEFYSQNKIQETSRADLAAFLMERDNKVCGPYTDISNSVFVDSQSHPSVADPVVDGGQRKKSKRMLHSLHDLTWNTFCQAAFDHFGVDLEEVYFARSCSNSKKLKFLKCWMKQIKNCNSCSFNIPKSSNTDHVVSEDINQRTSESPQKSQLQVSCSASLGEGFSRILDESANDSNSETLEHFFSSIANKIQQGLESKEVDSAAFAERLVSSCIYWLYKKHELGNDSEGQNSEKKSNDSFASKVAAELTELLLKDPKDLAVLHKKLEPCSQISDQRSTGPAPANIVREYELQILFRMEILLSEVVSCIGEPLKQKFVRHICSFLESIQCHLEGGFFGDWRLDNYVGKLIKSRYGDSLEDIVDKIYTRMDLSLFVEENESPIHSYNSEESNRSPKEKQEKDEKHENFRVEPVESRDKSLKHRKNDCRSSRGIRSEMNTQKLTEAREKRERARLYSSFTTWMPDLHRVWAPKQLKGLKPRSDHLHKFSKRKSSGTASHDYVCETPMTDKRASWPRVESGIDDKVQANHGTRSFSPVSKALFQDGL